MPLFLSKDAWGKVIGHFIFFSWYPFRGPGTWLNPPKTRLAYILRHKKTLTIIDFFTILIFTTPYYPAYTLPPHLYLKAHLHPLCLLNFTNFSTLPLPHITSVLDQHYWTMYWQAAGSGFYGRNCHVWIAFGRFGTVSFVR